MKKAIIISPLAEKNNLMFQTAIREQLFLLQKAYNIKYLFFKTFPNIQKYYLNNIQLLIIIDHGYFNKFENLHHSNIFYHKSFKLSLEAGAKIILLSCNTACINSQPAFSKTFRAGVGNYLYEDKIKNTLAYHLAKDNPDVTVVAPAVSIMGINYTPQKEGNLGAKFMDVRPINYVKFTQKSEGMEVKIRRCDKDGQTKQKWALMPNNQLKLDAPGQTTLKLSL